MIKHVGWRIAIVVVVVAAAAWAVYPPEERINLGLDLQGGSHIVMQVETESALQFEMDLMQSRLGQALKEESIAYDSVSSPEPTQLEIRGTDPARRADVRRVLEDYLGQWDVSGLGSGDWRVTMPSPVRQAIAKSAVETILTTLRNRVDELGVREPIIQKQGLTGDRILIQLPGVADPERAKDILQEPAVLEWKEVVYPPGVSDTRGWIPPASREQLVQTFGGTLPSNVELYPQRIASGSGGTTTLWWPLNTVSVVVGPDLKSANRSVDQFGSPNIQFLLSQEAGRRFETATRENLGRKMAIVLGGVENKEVISAPVINGIIRDQGVIEGSFTVDQAEDLALKLRSGAIPADVRIIEERTVGPSLGLDSIQAGLLAGVVGFALVLLFMLVYYRLAGINAVVGLALNIVLLLGAMAYLGATLTLPGIAGLILTVGMAVDSNVLIFERIREELSIGKTVRSAVDQGFGRAFLTIIDCNVTTLIAAAFLFSYGTGPVKGFAVTLFWGLLASLFTQVFVSRTIFMLLLGERRKVESLSI